MAFPITLDPSAPADLTSPGLGATEIRALEQFLADLLGIPVAPTSITAPAFIIGSNGVANDALPLVNKAGVGVVDGDVVAFDTANDSSVALSDVLGSMMNFVVARATIAANASGPFTSRGIVSVNATGSIARGQYVIKSATTKTVQDAGITAGSATPAYPGVLGVALAAASGGKVLIYKFPTTITGGGDISCRVRNTTALTIGDTTPAALTFDAERWDTFSLHSTSSNTSRIIPSIPGRFLIGGHIEWAANATGIRTLSIRLNGTTTLAMTSDTVVAAVIHQQSVSTEYVFNGTTDYVELMVSQTSGGPLNVNASGNYSPEFWASLVTRA